MLLWKLLVLTYIYVATLLRYTSDISSNMCFNLLCSLLQGLEQVVHGRGRNVDSLDETYLGVHEELLYARKTEPVEGNILGHYLLKRKYTFGCPYNLYSCIFIIF